MTQLPTAAAWLSVGSVLFVLFGWIAYAMTHSIGAEEVEAEIRPRTCSTSTSAVPHLEATARSSDTDVVPGVSSRHAGGADVTGVTG